MQISEFITEQDINEAAKTPIPFGPIGEIVDIRTYRRWLPEKKRRETAYERNARVVNYNCSLVADIVPHAELLDEAHLMFKRMNELKADASGRTKWIGGTESNIKHAASSFNCSYMAINRLGAFSDLFELLMLGTGVGFRVFQKDVDQLPCIATSSLDVEFEVYNPLPKSQRKENTYVNYDHEKASLAGLSGSVYVGDSRDGWIQALMIYLEAVTDPSLNVTRLTFNVDSVRSMGERIKGFGGTASGPDALKGIIQDVVRIIQEIPGDRLRPIDAMDICCAIAKGVVAGSSRRSALICLFEEGDKDCAESKTGLWTDPSKSHKQYRSQSNNTCDRDTAPSLEQLVELVGLESFRQNGEPAIANRSARVRRRIESATKWRPHRPLEWFTDVSTNPCFEINGSTGIPTENKEAGKSGGFCNLVSLPLTNFVIESQTKARFVDWKSLEECVRLITRISLRQTFVDIPMEGWSETQLEERLLGVDCCGWQNFFDLLGWSSTGEESIATRKTIREWANDEATVYANRLGCPRPLLVTCAKPNGTAAQVYGTSSGIHWDWSPFYVRRVRMTSQDALAKTLIEQGYSCYPESYELDNVQSIIEPKFVQSDWNNLSPWQKLDIFNNLESFAKKQVLDLCNTVVFEFPVKSPAIRCQSEISILEQLESSKLFNNEFCDHMASCTITVKEDEWDIIPKWLHENWNEFVTASFLPHYGGKYPLLPFEEITEEEYKRRLNEIPDRFKQVNDNGTVTFKVAEELLNLYERQIENPDDVELTDSACEKGSCPLR